MTLDKKPFENTVEKRENAGNQNFLLFSSPEHEVLEVSYSDQSMSVCPFTITKKIFFS